MQNRRDFLKTAALAALGSGLVVRQTLAGESLPYNINKLGLGGKMKMKFAYNDSRCAGGNRI